MAGIPPTSGDWFRIEPLAPGVTRIVEPHVHQFFRANAYRIAGRDLDLQLDFGNGVASLSAALPAGPRPVLGVASHAHVDHVGSFHEFDRRAGHRLEADIFATMDDAGTFASWFAGFEGVLIEPPSPGWSMAGYRLEPAPLTMLLEEGDTIDLGDRRLAVLHLPGHSPGSIGLLDETDGIFFSADAIYEGGLIDDIAGSHVETYLATMARLAELDVVRVFPGHGEPFGRDVMHAIALDYIRSKG